MALSQFSLVELLDLFFYIFIKYTFICENVWILLMRSFIQFSAMITFALGLHKMSVLS